MLGRLKERIVNRQYPAIVKYLLLIAGAFVLGVVLFDAVIMPALTGRRDVVTAPMLEGSSLNRAQEVCRREELELVIAGRRNSDEIPVDYVISQTPRQGARLKEGRTIKVIVSDGRRVETVPELRGTTQRESEALLESAGLARGRVVRIALEGAGQPAIVASTPSAQTRVPRGASVDLLLAARGEPRAYVMPDLVGRDFPFVKERLEKLDFNVVHRVTRRAEGAFPNAIVSQLPAPGSKIKEGDTIELVVSAPD